jgi:branched-chain amino acid transport system permease protein
MDTTSIIQILIYSLSLGGLYALMALGLALLYGILELVNFAYGEIVMIAAYTIYVLGYLLFPELPWSIVALAAIVLATFASLLLERVAFRPVRDTDQNTMLITSFAVSTLLQNSAILFISPRPRPLRVPSFFIDVIRVGDLVISKGDLSSILTSFAVLFLLLVFMRRTILGSALRAAASDFTMTRLLGIYADQIIAIAFAISGCLAGIVSLFWLGRIGSVMPNIGLTPVLIAFIASVVGGLGSLEGAVIGGYTLGFLTIALNHILPTDILEYRQAILFGLVIFILVIRPEGLTRRTKEGI